MYAWAPGRTLSELSVCSTVMTFATVGYGDIYAKTLVEELVADFMMIFGILLFGFIIGASRYASPSHPLLSLSVSTRTAPCQPLQNTVQLQGCRLLLLVISPGASLTGCTRTQEGQSLCKDIPQDRSCVG